MNPDEATDPRPFRDGEPPAAWMMVDADGKRSLDKGALTLDAVPLWAFHVGTADPVAWLAVFREGDSYFTFNKSEVAHLEAEGATVLALYRE